MVFYKATARFATEYEGRTGVCGRGSNHKRIPRGYRWKPGRLWGGGKEFGKEIVVEVVVQFGCSGKLNRMESWSWSWNLISLMFRATATDEDDLPPIGTDFDNLLGPSLAINQSTVYLFPNFHFPCSVNVEFGVWSLESGQTRARLFIPVSGPSGGVGGAYI